MVALAYQSLGCSLAMYDKNLPLTNWLFTYIYLLTKITLGKTVPISRIFESTNRIHTGEVAIENVNNFDERRLRIIIVGNRVFYCHLSPDWRQMSIENNVSSGF